MGSFGLVATALLALISATLTLTLRRHLRLYILAFLAIPQFFIPGVPLPLAQAYALFLLAASFFDPALRVRNRAITVPLWILASLTALALALPPHPSSAANILISYATWACMLRYVWAERDHPRHLYTAVALTIPWILAEAVLTILFRLRPAVESAFLHSRLAELLIGPAAPALFSGEPNNVLDPTKAGGLFVNGNVASMFLGVSCLALAILARRTHSRVLGALSVLIVTAVVATGSKTGIVLTITLPLVAWTLYRVSQSAGRNFILPAILVVAISAIAAPTAISALFPSFSARGDAALGTRGGLWGLAGRLFVEHPILGVGWDGFRDYALQFTGSSFPPHNIIIAAWANTGILGALAVVAFMVACLTGAAVATFKTTDARRRHEVVYALCAVLWVFVHGMGDNTTIFGEAKTMVLFSILLGLAMPASRAPETTRTPSKPLDVSNARTLNGFRVE